mmetsp:Transcript_17590/g.41305  ORF Transcript_17590/g.41305 Transcript_17590/m.41305 type:complete len:278 (-) Transcript_17590:551-1384(-)
MSFRNDAMFDSTRSIVAKSLASVALRCSSRLSAVSSSDSATPNGLSILALTRSSFDKISVIKASRASNRDDSQCRDPAPTDGSPGEANFARSASRADTGKTIGVPRGPPPIMAVPLSRTKTVTSCTAFSSGRLSILLTTKTTFLPHPLISSKKFFSLSLKGRSEEVTNKTKSALGTIRRVSCSCAEITAFVPGVSTTARSDSHGTGSLISCTSSSATPKASTCVVTDCFSPYFSTQTCAVVGSTPSATNLSPRRALMKDDLPALNSPTIHTMKSSSI